jgi:recombination protein RecR
VSAIDDLVTELAKLPGIGRKTAQRLTFYLLKQPAEAATRLADAIRNVRARVTACSVCGTMTDDDPCAICRDPRREASLLCVVEEAADVAAIERSGRFRGRYHVLGGRLSPLEGVGPEALRVEALLARVANGSGGGGGGVGGVREVIIATNPSMEGEVTATYLQQALKPTGVRITRIARGLPVGGDLEYADAVTIAQALEARREIPES